MGKTQGMTFSIITLLIIVLIVIAAVLFFSFSVSGNAEGTIKNLFNVGDSGIEHGLNPTPVADFSFSPEAGSAPLEVGFVDESSVEAVSWQWDFDNDGIYDSTEQYPVHIYKESGIYTVRLTASNEQGYSDDEVKENIIFVDIGPPEAGFNFSPQTGQAPLTVQFTDTSTNSPDYWEWYFDIETALDGSDVIGSDKQNPSHVFSKAGIYNIALTAYNPEGSDTATNTITVLQPPPKAEFTYAPSSSTAPFYVQFTDTSTGSPTAWSWDFDNDGFVDSSSQNPEYRYLRPGTYTVKLNVSGSTGSDSKTKTNIITVTGSRCSGGNTTTLIGQSCTNYCEYPNTCKWVINDCDNFPGCTDSNDDGFCEGGTTSQNCWFLQTKESCDNWVICEWK
jgi:PKD repeat protein